MQPSQGRFVHATYLLRRILHCTLTSGFNFRSVVKVANYSIHKRLSDLVSQTHTNYSKKTDIYNFGTFLLSLLQGIPVPDENVEIPSSIPSDLYDFLGRCLSQEEKERFTAAQLLNHQFFRKPVVHFSPKHNKVEEIVLDRNISPDIPQNDVLELSQASGQSRINNEFEFLQHLGKGAFGDVIKVRNKLDGGYYAIKRIQLNPKNKQLNKKIVREVKLLSRLNHENVVRYYNSWIETTTIKGEDSDISTSSSDLNNIPKVIRKDEFTLNDNIEELAPPMKNVEISVTYDSKSQAAFASSSEDDSSDDDETWGIFPEDSDSDSIEFEHDSTTEDLKISASKDSVQNNESQELPQESVKQIDFMYIQMEFCEKSTLRTAIDNNLYLDDDRLWRLFREVVEGLAHIHQQGMIHRDLKPVNIFLDSDDHVKIGDFGLATTSMKARQNEYFLTKSALEIERDDLMDESKTGQIGTALYVAPELSVANKAIYNQKVDIYSLGIIFFEMCYRPLITTMERIKILTGLRLIDVILPEDFKNEEDQRKQVVIRWLLNHDISKRPTSQALLQSEHVPPPVLEERELRELVRHTLSNPQLKGYKYLIASCFQQPVTPAQDITYDKDPLSTSMAKPLHLYGFVRQATLKIFQAHSGQNLATPLLIPKSKYFEDSDSCVKLMTHFGGIVSLPHDLRVPFARYVAWNGITLFRRYSIERVYREKKVFGFIPRELYECAFDIVSPSPGSLTTDAEILYIVFELINALPGLRNKHFTIRLNHTSLLKAILLYFGVKDNHDRVFHTISDTKESKDTRYKLQNYLMGIGLKDNAIPVLKSLLNSEFEVSKASNHLQMITKKKSEAGKLAKEAIHELKLIAQNAEAFGITFDMVVAPGLVYNVEQYSGMICQFVCELKKKHKHSNLEVVAAGGRYDSMIAYYRSIMDQANMLGRDIQQSAVGISISLDKLVQGMQKEEPEELQLITYVDAVVCSIGSKQMLHEKTKILKKLWENEIKCFSIESTNIEEIQEQCGDLRVPHIIILKDNDPGTIRVRSWDRDRFQEKSYSEAFFTEEIPRIFKNIISKSDSKNLTNERCEHVNEANVIVLFITNDKLSANSRKRYENQVRSRLDSVFKKLNGNVIVLGLSLESNVVRTLASYLEFDTKQQFRNSVENVIERHQKLKKYLNDICDEIYDQKIKKNTPIIVLYSLQENFYKLIL